MALPLVTSKLRHANPAYPRPMTASAEKGGNDCSDGKPADGTRAAAENREIGASRWQLVR
jgi:hypothetical protein